MIRHMLDAESLSHGVPERLMDRAEHWAKMLESGQKVEPVLDGKIFFNLFFEDSTRTRMSFELAAKRLGADVINFATQTSSIKKNESYYDTLANLAAMNPDGVILRHSEYNAPRFAAGIFKCPIINGGDSWRSHPTQALLDALTMRQIKGRIAGLTVAICGDIAHSRVARSNYVLLTRLGAHVRIVAPPMLMPQEKEFTNAERCDTLEKGIKDADIIMMLRLQKERMQAGMIDNDSTYFKSYGLTPERLALAKPDVYVMHPGPMNRGVEISDEVADDPQKSLILKQAALGVPVRMAVLEWACGGL
jgi:aspartate carbamoyltransferase catalytic subunit